MKSLPFLLFATSLFFAVLAGCKQPVAERPDSETNTYQVAYTNIYKTYGAIPLDTTKKQLELYLEEFPQNADAWMFYGNVCFKAADYGSARVSYSKAIAIDAGKSTYYSALGTAYSAQNMVDSAEKYLLKSVEMRDTSPYTLLNLAILYSKKNEPVKSETFADAAAASRDSSTAIYSGLSYVYMKLGAKQKSNDMFEAAKAFGLKDTVGLNDVLAEKMKIEDFYRKNY